jgi:hypothetical protein
MFPALALASGLLCHEGLRMCAFYGKRLARQVPAIMDKDFIVVFGKLIVFRMVIGKLGDRLPVDASNFVEGTSSV